MNDLISRQDAIDLVQIYLNPFMKYIGSPEDTECEAYARTILQNIVDNLRVGYKTPSAQPEIIRCKDCKWWDKSEDSPFGYCMAMKHGYMSANWEIGIYRRYKGDFYCADAERRTDENN